MYIRYCLYFLQLLICKLERRLILCCPVYVFCSFILCLHYQCNWNFMLRVIAAFTFFWCDFNYIGALLTKKCCHNTNIWDIGMTVAETSCFVGCSRSVILICDITLHLPYHFYQLCITDFTRGLCNLCT